MIRTIGIGNFEAFGEGGAEIDLGKISILAGRNNSGKSSFLEALLLIKQSVNHSTINYNEPDSIVDFGGFEGIVHRGDTDRNIWIKFTVDMEGEPNIDEIIGSLSGLIDIGYSDVSKGLSYELVIEKEDFVQTVSIGNKKVFEVNSRGEILEPVKIKTLGTYSSQFKILSLAEEPEYHELEVIMALFKILRENIEAFHYVSSDRGLFNWSDKIQEESFFKDYVGFQGEYSLLKLYELHRNSLREEEGVVKEMYDCIIEELSNFGLKELLSGMRLGSRLFADYLDDTGYVANLKQAGAGSRQLLPLIVQLFCVKDSTIAIEEPEVSLHAEGQKNVIFTFFKAAKELNNNIVFTTHSNIPILSIPLVIENHPLDFKDIKVFHFERSEETDYEALHSELELNEYGYLVKPIPSYFEVERSLFKKWAETLGDEDNLDLDENDLEDED
ncbi:MAG: AAA family ATPase [Elusimicrobiota bacterium]